jgi:hypothetical protein
MSVQNNNTEIKSRLERDPIFWMHEAIVYLGLDRLGLINPEQVIYRMVRKGILKPVKIGRFLAFSKSELDYVIVNGEKKKTPGRPRKIEKIMICNNTV